MNPPIPEPAPAATRARVRPAFALGAALFLGSWLAYAGNCRTIANDDTLATAILPFAIWNGDGLVLDRYVGHGFPEHSYSFARDTTGHWRSLFPAGAALVATPLYLPLAFADAVDPAEPEGRLALARVAEKYAAATIASLAVLLLFELLRHFTSLGRAALLAAIFALATPTWTVSSQALWQHGPTLLVLIVAFRLLLVGKPGPATAALAGALVALVATIRPPNLLLTLPLAVIALRRDPRRLGVPLLLAAALGGALLAGWNLAHFDSLRGAYVKFHFLERLFDFRWSRLAGLLFSHRGLLLFCPFLPLLLRFRSPHPGLSRSERVAIGLTLGAFLTFYAGFAQWAGGEGWGGRYLADALPLCFLLGARAFDAPFGAFRRTAWVLTGTTAFAIQALGAATFGFGETALASHVANGFWDRARSPISMGLESGFAPAELRPLTRFGRALPLPDADRRARLELVGAPPESWPAGAKREIRLRLTNLGGSTWSSRGGPGGANAVLLVSSWVGRRDRIVHVARHPLPSPMAPGESREVALSLLAPPRPGSHRWSLALIETTDAAPRLFAGEAAGFELRVKVAPSIPNWTERGYGYPAAVPIFSEDFESRDLSRWKRAPAR